MNSHTFINAITFSFALFIAPSCFGQMDRAGAKSSDVTVDVTSIDMNNSDFISLSLVDSALYHDFKKGVQAFRSTEKNVLVTVVEREENSEQRMEFMVLFYNNLFQTEGKKDVKEIYEQTYKEIKSKYAQLQFKTRLFIVKRHIETKKVSFGEPSFYREK